MVSWHTPHDGGVNHTQGQARFFALFLAGIFSTPCLARLDSLDRPSTLQEAIDLELEETARSLHPKKTLILVVDTETGEFIGLGGMTGRHQLRGEQVRWLAKTMQYDPGATLDAFSDEDLARKGMTRRATTPTQILQLYRAVAKGGLFCEPTNAAQPKGATGSSGHSRGVPDAKATASFIGFYPPRNPKQICLVLVEAARVLPKYNRGALVAAPIFSRIVSSEIIGR